jgi:hypothetical protein
LGELLLPESSASGIVTGRRPYAATTINMQKGVTGTLEQPEESAPAGTYRRIALHERSDNNGGTLSAAYYDDQSTTSSHW